jgi:1-phosphofructokinase family hexose kinase
MIYTVTLNPALDREYSVDHLEKDEVLRASAVRVDFGGKGFNISRMLCSLGGSSVALGFVGGGTGKIIQNGLSAAGVKTSFTQVAGETRTDISIVSEADKHYIKLNEPGPNISAEEINRLLEQVDALIHSGDWWVLAGSLPPGVSDDIYATIINRVQRNGAFAVLDASGPALYQGVRAGPFLIKPNTKETSQLIAREVNSLPEMLDALPVLHGLGARLAMISAGKDGALLSDGQKRWYCQAPKIQERNPIGAGDAMVAGLVWRLSQHDELRNALAWAIACGTAAASQPGTAMPGRAGVEQFLKQIEVKEVK